MISEIVEEKKLFRTHNKNPATTKWQPCGRKPHPAIFHKHHNNAPGTLSTMTELLTHPDCLKKPQQLKLEKAKVILVTNVSSSLAPAVVQHAKHAKQPKL